MPTTIRLPLRALNAEVIKDLQEKYPDAENAFFQTYTGNSKTWTYFDKKATNAAITIW